MTPRARRLPVLAMAAVVLPGLAPHAVAAPAAGHYEATLCVAVAQKPPQCGPADVRWDGSGYASVRINDLDYRLWLAPGKLIVILMHGSMQVQEFDTAYAWQDHTLKFADTERELGYEVTLGARKPP